MRRSKLRRAGSIAAAYLLVAALAVLEKQVRGVLKSVQGLMFSGSTGSGAEPNYKARAISLTYAEMERLG